MKVRLLVPFFTVTILLAQKPEQLVGTWKITTEITSVSMGDQRTLSVHTGGRSFQLRVTSTSAGRFYLDFSEFKVADPGEWLIKK